MMSVMPHAPSPPSPSRAPASTPDAAVLGVDPGLQRTGYALVRAGARTAGTIVEAGVIRLDARRPVEDRLVELEQSLERLILLHRPSLMCCEELYAHYRHPRTAILMGHARGVILLVAARCRLRVVSLAATHVKKFLTGSGHAGKTQIQRAVALTLGLPRVPEPHDVADAIALALCVLRMPAAAMSGRRGAGNGR